MQCTLVGVYYYRGILISIRNCDKLIEFYTSDYKRVVLGKIKFLVFIKKCFFFLIEFNK